MIKRHKFDECGVAVMSHSMGTIHHSMIVKGIPYLIRRSAFVDPVCFQLWAPHVCYRFLYKHTDSFVEAFLRYFVARELGTAFTITRHFDWVSNVLLAQDVPHPDDPDRLRIYLAGHDTVLDAESVRSYLDRNGLRRTVHFVNGEHHGALAMIPNRHLDELLAWLDAPMKIRAS